VGVAITGLCPFTRRILTYSEKRRADNQLPLFESPIIEELRRVNPNQLTPLQAVQILSDLQARAFELRDELYRT